jgi:hypothetical protein
LQFFKREEINFASQHHIDNTSMLMPTGTKPTTNPLPAKNQKDIGGKNKRKKRRVDREKFTSLTVACIKRLLPIGINTFGGREQELVQLAKQKMIEVIEPSRTIVTFPLVKIRSRLQRETVMDLSRLVNLFHSLDETRSSRKNGESGR